MPQYLHIENQRILWNAISMNTDFDKCNINKRDWFEMILSNFNDKCKTPDINKHELMQLNRETIDYMVQDLKSINAVKQVKQDDFQSYSSDSNFSKDSFLIKEPSFSKDSFLIPQTIQEKNIRSENLDQKYASVQDEYKALNFRPIPQEIDFRYKDKDEPIMDMENLLQRHMKDRELTYPPTTSNRMEDMPSMGHINNTGPVKLTILSDIINLDAPIHDLESDLVLQKQKEFKKVSWGKEHLNTPNTEFLESEIKWLKELYIGLRQEMDELKREFGK
jgi:hypothetical protein